MISDEDVKKIARLAHLQVSDEEAHELQKKVSAVIEYVNQLQAINVAGVAAMSHVHGSTNVFREDRADSNGLGQSLDVQQMLSNVPDHSGRFIKVPIIVE